MQQLYVLIGPTAVGKTALALQLAERLEAPILNCDSRQLYRDLPIATAAPTAEQMARVPHHFVGTLGLDDTYSAARYEADVLQLMAQGDPDGNFVLTGGSMLYIDAVCRGIDQMPEADSAIRAALQQQLADEGLAPLLSRLAELDPDYYARVDRQNPQRVLHGLEMCLTTGRPFSTFHTGQAKPRPFEVHWMGLQRPREELYQRIDQRIGQMMEQGLEAEARRVYERYADTLHDQLANVVRNPGPTQAQPIPNLSPPALNTVGLREMLLYFEGIYTLPRALERIAHNTRIYSKKQMTWFNRNPEIQWFHPDHVELAGPSSGWNF